MPKPEGQRYPHTRTNLTVTGGHANPHRDGPPGWVSQYPPGHENPRTAAVTAVLQRWFEAIEQGTAEYWQPDTGSPHQYDDETLERMVAALDQRYREILSSRFIFWFADTDPGFSRLAPAQRLAMAQELRAALSES